VFYVKICILICIGRKITIIIHTGCYILPKIGVIVEQVVGGHPGSFDRSHLVVRPGSATGRAMAESRDVTAKKCRKQSPAFLFACCIETNVVAMGVLDRARAMSGLTDSEDDGLPYVCLACETALEVQHHNCPVCGSFDIRCSKWIRE
jgi:hypothetical protein